MYFQCRPTTEPALLFSAVMLLASPFLISLLAHVLTTPRMRYCIDKASPSNWDQPDEVYEILSKPTREGVARAEKDRTATLMEALQM